MADVVIQVKTRGGATIHKAAVLAAYPDGRYLTGQTDADGKCRLNLYRVDQEMKILIAADGHLPFHETLVPGTSETVSLELEPSKDDRKALLFTRSTGYIPGITGRLNPHKDGYVYGDNIAINGTTCNACRTFRDRGVPPSDRRVRRRDNYPILSG